MAVLTASTGATAAMPSPYRLVVEPNDGMTPIYTLLASPQRTLDMTMYELADPRAEAELAADQRRGVQVRVVLDQYRRSANQPAYGYLKEHGVAVRWSSPHFRVTHEKSVVIDDTTLVVMTLNLTSRYYLTTRDFAVVDTAAPDVAAVEEVFGADFAGRPLSSPPLGLKGHLVWSPGAGERLVKLVASAQRRLLVENEELSDRSMVHALEDAAARGVSVELVMTDDSAWHRNFDALKRAGVHVRVFSPSGPLYVHAKVIDVDPGQPDEQLWVGSQNFSPTSLEYNRELGLIIGAGQGDLVDEASHVLTSDFARARPW